MMRWFFAAALLLLAGCRSSADRQIYVDPALATLVPSDTTVLVGLRLDKLKLTPIYQRHLGASLQLQQIDEFARKTGVDPRKDIWEILYCSNGKSAGVTMIRGRFSNEAEPTLKGEGMEHFGYKGFNLYGSPANAILFINSSTAMAGETPSLKRIIDERDRSHGIPTALLTLLQGAPPNSQFWAAFTGGIGPIFPENSELGNANQLLARMRDGFFAADLNSGVEAAAQVDCKSQDDARQIHDALRGIIGMGRLNTPNKEPELLRMYDSINVVQDNAAVRVKIQAPDELVERMIEVFWKSRPAGPPPVR